VSRLLGRLAGINLALLVALGVSLVLHDLLPPRRPPLDHSDCVLRARGSLAIASLPGAWTRACLYEIEDWSSGVAASAFPEFLLDDIYVVALILSGPGGQAEHAFFGAQRLQGEPHCIPVTPESRVVLRESWRNQAILGLAEGSDATK
jgi:hypothetical protein